MLNIKVVACSAVGLVTVIAGGLATLKVVKKKKVDNVEETIDDASATVTNDELGEYNNNIERFETMSQQFTTETLDLFSEYLNSKLTTYRGADLTESISELNQEVLDDITWLQLIVDTIEYAKVPTNERPDWVSTMKTLNGVFQMSGKHGGSFQDDYNAEYNKIILNIIKFLMEKMKGLD